MADTERVVGVDGVRFTVLRGGIDAVADSGPLSLGGQQQRRLLGALLAEHDSIITVDRLIEAMWSDGAAPDGARRTVMTYVSRLRSVIGHDHLLTHENGYELVLADAAYDVDEFTAAVAAAREAGPGDAVGSLAAYDRALSLWTGRPFGDDGDESWLRPTVARLEELRLVVLEERAERLLDAGRPAEAVADLEGLTVAHPLRERFVELLMRALYQAGRQAEALRAYRRFAENLADETGLSPSDALADLEHRITLGDESLSAPTGLAVPGYELREKIGEGAFGAVYRAVQPSVRRDVAVKVVRPELADDPRFVQRFEAEAQLVARLEHPHVVPLYDFWRRPGGAFLVFRLLRGGSLSDRLTHGPLTVAEVTRMLTELGGALDAAHVIGVVHRDIKPGNVLFDDVGNSYLADFGIAVLEGVDADVDLRSAGSPLYASPEQARDGVATAASDQYALGVVAWEALTGRAPFTGSTVTELLRTKLGASVPSLAGIVDVPATLDDVLARATAPHPADRFDSVAGFVDAWLAAAQHADMVSTPGGVRLTPEARSAGVTASVGVGAVNPYKGLRAFREADAAEFHGRGALIDRLLECIVSDPFVAVVGPSGSGKSSIVHAGAVPGLRRLGAQVVTMVPGADPLTELETALRRVATAHDGDLRGRLMRDDGLVEIARGMVTPGQQLVLVVDQFEELWTLCESSEQRDRFASLLVGAASAQDVVRVVVTLRADLYDRPLQHQGLGPVISASTLAVTPMTATELQEAIQGPAAQVGVRFEPGLVATMISDVVARPGALPLLQFALTELFERRINAVIPTAAYAEIGGIGGALATRAEQLYEATAADKRPDVHRLFTQLVTPGEETDDLRRRATYEEVADVAPDVVERYLANRLLVSDHDPITREPTIEVAHEALLREWPRLRGWIDGDRDTIRMRRSLVQAAGEWEASGRDESALLRGTRLGSAEEVARRVTVTSAERELVTASEALAAREQREAEERSAAQVRQNRRLRRLLVATATVLVVALVAGGVAVVQRNRATTNEARATAASDEARGQALSARSTSLLAANQVDEGILTAVEAQRFATRSGAGGSTAVQARAALLQSVVSSPSLVGFYNGQSGRAFQIHYSPHGRYLLSTSYASDVRVWNGITRQPIDARIPKSWSGEDMAITDSGLVATKVKGSAPQLWNVKTAKPWPWQPSGSAADPYAVETYDYYRPVALHGDQLLAAVDGTNDGSASPTIDLWDVAHRTMIGGVSGLAGQVTTLSFSPDGSQLAVSLIAAGGTSVDLVLIDTRTATVKRRIVAHRPSAAKYDFFSRLFSVELIWSADGRTVSSIAPGSQAGAIATFDAATGAPVASSSVGAGQDVVAVSSDLQTIVVANADGTSDEVVDARNGDVRATLPAQSEPGLLDPVVVDPRGTRVVSQPLLGPLAIFDWTHAAGAGFSTRTPSTPPPDLTAAFASLGREPASQFGAWWGTAQSRSGLVAMLHPGGVAIWDPATRRVVRNLTGAPPECAVAPGWSSLIKFPVPYPRLSFQSRATTGRSGRLVAGCGGKLVSWDLARSGSTPDWTQPWSGPRNDIPIGPVLSADGSVVAVITGFTGSHFFDAATGRPIADGPAYGADEPLNATLSADGSTFATVQWTGDVTVVDTKTGRQLQTLKSRLDQPGKGDIGLTGRPTVAISPDEQYVAAWHNASGAELWNLKTGDSIAVLDGRTPSTVKDGVNREVALRFTDDSSQLVARSTTGDAQETVSWSMRPADWATTGCRIVGRNMTRAEWRDFFGSSEPYHATCS